MQPGLFTLNWPQVIGMLAAPALVCGIFFSLFRFERRSREPCREKPPQMEKILRPPGYSAMCKIDELVDKSAMAAFQTIMASLVFGLGCGTFYPVFYGLAIGRFTLTQLWAAPKPLPVVASVLLLMGLVSLVWLVWHSCRVWKLFKEIRDWRFGMRGEQAVAEKLADPSLAAAGYVAFHDIPGNGKSKWNIDHVVVGPGGVFVLETKARPRRKATRSQEEQDVFFDGRRLQFPWCYNDQASKQVERNAQSIREILSGCGL